MPPSVATATTHYALVVDAGSSGSRLQIYSWRDPSLERAEILSAIGNGKGKGKERERETALRRLVRVGKGVEGDDWVKRVEPGLSTQTPSTLNDYFTPMLSHALRHIPPSQHAQTPIYVLATAGMRLLPPQRQNALLKGTCKLLKSYPFQTGDNCENVQIISGEEEGMWGWVAVNYLMDGFGHAPSSSSKDLLPLAPLADPPPDSSHDSPTMVDVKHHSPTFGFLDMGGASTQLAFSPTWRELERSGYPRDQLREVSLRLLSGEDVSWPVFVASWLGFGTNKVRERYVEARVNKWKDAQKGKLDMTPLQDPCLPAGLQHESTPSAPPFIGTGDFSTCLSQLHPLLLHSTPCPTDHCLFAGLPTPHIDFSREDQRGFIGVSEYWYTAQQVLGLGGVWDWAEWERGMGEFCARDWTDVKAEMEREKGWKGAQIELSRLEMQCFKGAWISNVLHDGIGIPRLTDVGGNTTLTGGQVGDTNDEAERRAREKGLASKHHFQSMDEIGETAISWTLGKMVIEASKAVPRTEIAPWDKARTGFERRLGAMGIEVIWAYAFIAFVLCTCFLAGVRKHRWALPGRRGYKPARIWRSEEDAEEGGKAKVSLGPIRRWALRASRAVRWLPALKQKVERPRPTRMASMPNLSSSPPASPKGYFFTPAEVAGPSLHPSSSRASLTSGETRSRLSPADTPRGLTSSGSASAVDIAGNTVPPPSQGGSPPRSKTSSGRGKTRQGIHSHLSVLTTDPSSGGWNDPPSFSRESQHRDSLSVDREPTSGVLTPSAGATNGTALSRNSSRVNLSDLGLALRSSSRATTPFDNEE